MKAFFLIFVPSLLISLVPEAQAMGGKKVSDPALPSGLVSTVGNRASAQAVDPTLAFANWCQSHLGHLSPDQSQCVTQLNYRFSKKPHSELWNSDVHLAVHDTVIFHATGSPKVLVGLAEGNLEEDSEFVAGAEGKLAFSSPGKGKKFSVTQVQVRRCFEASGKSVLCSQGETTAEESPRRGNESNRRKRPASVGQARIAS